MSIEKKPVNTFWCAETNQWNIYLTPENPTPDISVSLPKKENIEDSILALRKKITENPTYVKLSSRDQENYAALFDGKTITHEADWASIGSVSAAGFTSVLTIIIAIMFFLRSNSASSPTGNSQNNSQPQESPNSSTTQPNNSGNLTANLVIGIGFTVISFLAAVYFAYRIQNEGKEKNLYDKYMKKVIELLLPAENEIRKKQEVIIALVDAFKKTNTLIKGLAISTSSSDEEKDKVLINISKEKEEYNFYSEILVLIDSKNDIGLYDRAYEFYKFLEDSPHYEIKDILLQLFKTNIMRKVKSSLKNEEIHAINKSSTIEEVFETLKEKHLANFEVVSQEFIKLLENKSKLVAISSLIKLFIYVFPKNEIETKSNLFMSYIENFLDMFFSKLPNKFVTIDTRVNDIFKNEENSKSIINHIIQIHDGSDDTEDFVEKYVFFLGDTQELNKYYDFSYSNKNKVSVYGEPSKDKIISYGKLFDNRLPIILLKAILPDSQNEIEFEEHIVKADGDCGFTAMGTDRKALSQKLLSLKNVQKNRQFLAEEIINAFFTYSVTNGEDGLIPPKDKIKLWEKIQTEHVETQKSFDVLFSKIQNELSEKKVITQDDITSSIDWLTNNGQSEKANILQESYLKVVESQNKLELFCEDTVVFDYYTKALSNTGLWLGYKSALLYAKNTNIDLYIWRKDTKNKNCLVLIDCHESNANNPHKIHMLHTGGFTHFNLLSEKPTQIDKESYPLVTQIEINKTMK